jgi:hypothetical protein
MLNVEKLEQPQADLAYDINDVTGFAECDTFDSAEEVRDYFQRATLARLWHCAETDPDLPTQEELEEWAEFIIEHRLHCDF